MLKKEEIITLAFKVVFNLPPSDIYDSHFHQGDLLTHTHAHTPKSSSTPKLGGPLLSLKAHSPTIMSPLNGHLRPDPFSDGPSRRKDLERVVPDSRGALLPLCFILFN